MWSFLMTTYAEDFRIICLPERYVLGQQNKSALTKSVGFIL